MKRVLFITFSLIILTGMAWAGGGITLNAQKVLPGQTVTVAVTLDTGTAPMAAEVEMAYDPKALIFIKMEKGDLTQEAMEALNDKKPGLLHVAFAAGSPFPSAHGTLCTFVFNVRKGLKKTSLAVKKALINDKSMGHPKLTLDLTREIKR